MKRTSFFIPEQLLARLQALAERRGTPMAELVRQAVERFLKDNE